jgi:hypothetical protein
MPRKKIKISKSKSGNYLGVGHDVFTHGADLYNKENPNLIWGFKEGKVFKWEETPEFRGHASVPNWGGQEWGFYGRYDAKSHIVSCVICNNVHSFRKLPQSLVSQLEQAFPNAKKIVIF